MQDCWMKERCKKYKNGLCEDSFCIKKFKMEHLYKEALLTDKHKVFVPLRLDADGSDRDAFMTLKSRN